MGQQLTRRPENSGNVVATFTRGRLAADLSGYFRGRTLYEEPNYGASSGLFWNSGFANVGVNLNYALGRGVTAYGNLRNALNRQYEEVFGYPSPKLNFVAGMKWTIARVAMKEPFDQPRLAINRVYTRQGDSGETALVGGQRVPKDGTRIEAYGTVDELNSFLGAARATVNQLAVEEPRLALLAAILLRVQHELFNLGSILATLPEDVHPRQPRVTDAEIAPARNRDGPDE